MSAEIPEGPPLAQGRTAHIYVWLPGTILKLFHDWCSPSMVEHELRNAELISDLGLATPKVHGKVELEGRLGIIFEQVQGPTLLDLIESNPHRFPSHARLLADLHLQIHSKSSPVLGSRKQHLIRTIEQLESLPDGVQARALKQLNDLPEGQTVTHGDFHPDNVIMGADGPMIIDWPDAQASHPLADVARTSLLLQIGEPEGKVLGLLIKLLRGRFLKIYQRAYFAGSNFSQQEMESWWLPTLLLRVSEGIESEREQLNGLIREHMLSA
jgi:uncharacterized protein (TIGR02172 family)